MSTLICKGNVEIKIGKKNVVKHNQGTHYLFDLFATILAKNQFSFQALPTYITLINSQYEEGNETKYIHATTLEDKPDFELYRSAAICNWEIAVNAQVDRQLKSEPKVVYSATIPTASFRSTNLQDYTSIAYLTLLDGTKKKILAFVEVGPDVLQKIASGRQALIRWAMSLGNTASDIIESIFIEPSLKELPHIGDLSSGLVTYLITPSSATGDTLSLTCEAVGNSIGNISFFQSTDLLDSVPEDNEFTVFEEEDGNPKPVELKTTDKFIYLRYEPDSKDWDDPTKTNQQFTLTFTSGTNVVTSNLTVLVFKAIDTLYIVSPDPHVYYNAQSDVYEIWEEYYNKDASDAKEKTYDFYAIPINTDHDDKSDLEIKTSTIEGVSYKRVSLSNDYPYICFESDDVSYVELMFQAGADVPVVRLLTNTVYDITALTISGSIEKEYYIRTHEDDGDLKAFKYAPQYNNAKRHVKWTFDNNVEISHTDNTPGSDITCASVSIHCNEGNYTTDPSSLAVYNEATNYSNIINIRRCSKLPNFGSDGVDNLCTAVMYESAPDEWEEINTYDDTVSFVGCNWRVYLDSKYIHCTAVQEALKNVSEHLSVDCVLEINQEANRLDFVNAEYDSINNYITFITPNMLTSGSGGNPSSITISLINLLEDSSTKFDIVLKTLTHA